MEENNNEDLKNEVKEAVDEVKDSVQNANAKEATKNVQGFLKDMAKNPIAKTTEIAGEEGNKYLITSIVMLVIWVLAELLFAIFYYDKYSFFRKTALLVVKSTVAPLFIIATLTLTIFLLNKKHKKPLITVFATVTTAYSPVIVASVLHLLYLIDTQVSKLTTPITHFATFITVILTYFAIKSLFEDRTELGTFRKFMLIEGIYFIVAMIMSFLGISMYV